MHHSAAWTETLQVYVYSKHIALILFDKSILYLKSLQLTYRNQEETKEN